MPQYWFIVEALLALARHRKVAAKAFTRIDLRAWSDRINARPAAAQQALDHLERCGMVRRLPCADGAGKPGTWLYVITPEGAAAAKAAALSARAPKPRDKSSFAARLWSLLRMRTTLSATEAAATLVDAGEDVLTAARTASKYLRAWVRVVPHAVQTAKKREASGGMRFVLIKDIGPVAPPIESANKRAQGGAAA